MITFSVQYGLRGILLIIGGMTSHGIAFSFLYRQETYRQTTQKYKNETHSNDLEPVSTDQIDKKIYTVCNNKKIVQMKHSDKDARKIGSTLVKPVRPRSVKTEYTLLESFKIILSNKCYVTFCIGVLFVNPVVNCYTIFLIDIYLDKGFTIAEASLGLVIFNITANVGRLFPGFLTRLPCISTITVHIIHSTIGIIATITFLFVNTYIITLFCACLIGIVAGMLRSGMVVTTTALVGKSHLSNGMGILFTLNCVPNIVVGPISGKLTLYFVVSTCM